MLDIGREPQSQWVTQKPLRGLENDQTGRVRITHYPNTLLKHFYRGNTNFCTWVGSAPVAKVPNVSHLGLYILLIEVNKRVSIFRGEN